MARKKETRRRRASLDRHKVIDMMIDGLTDQEIADKLGSTSAVVSKVISRHIKEVTNVRETQKLLAAATGRGSHKAIKTMAKTRTINQKFLDKLSPPDAPLLSDPETMFCMVYVLTGNDQYALEEAGLDDGLQAPNSGDRHSLGYCKKLRCQYLKNKANIAATIQRHREEKFGEMIKDIDKRFVQGELLQQLVEMKEDPFSKKQNILNCLKLIGETVGAYTQNISVSKIDPAAALDELIEMAVGGEGEDEVYEADK